MEVGKLSHPALLILSSILEYKNHYESMYCRAEIFTVDNIRIYFKSQKFGHAFYENSEHKQGPKDQFSPERAQRMDWIKSTLMHSDALLFFGWNKDKKVYEESRRVSVVFEGFVVVIELGFNTNNVLRGNFVTCYLASDKTINAIKTSPVWNREQCIEHLRKNGS